MINLLDTDTTSFMKKIKILCILFFAGMFLSNAQNKPSINTSSPNVIIILVDDMGYNDVGFNGCLDIPTPNIDKIATQGVKFTSGYVSYAVCGPSRAGLLTGRYQDRFGFGRNPLFAPNDPSMGLPLSEETIADVLKKGNYKTVALGKWHMGIHESLRPLKRGFDDFYGFLEGGHDYFPKSWNLADEFEVKSQYEAYRTKLLRNNEHVNETEYLTDALSREAVNYIEKYKEQPFFMYLAYNAPHTPLQATEKYLKRFDTIKDSKRKTYAAMVSAVDDGVGIILDRLEKLGITENTIIFFLSDNGGPENANASDNGVLRGGKGDLFEGGIHVPFAMKWPKQIKAGQTYYKPIISLDILPTILAQVSTPIKTEHPLDGVNLLPYLNGNSKGTPHDLLFWRKFDSNYYSVRSSLDEKLVVKTDNKMLFNLKKDISEKENIIKSKPETFEKLQKKYEAWNLQMINPVFMGLESDNEYSRIHPNRFNKLD